MSVLEGEQQDQSDKAYGIWFRDSEYFFLKIKAAFRKAAMNRGPAPSQLRNADQLRIH